MQEFIDLYIGAARRQLEPLLGRPLDDGEVEAIRVVAADRMVKNDFQAVLLHPKRKAEGPVRLKGSLAAAWMAGRNPMPPIITGHGTLFRQHGEYNSVIGDLVAFLMGSRKVVKKQMLNLLREGRSPDDPEVKAADQLQKIWKLLANSFYGAFAEKGFHFYDAAMGPAVTYTGQLIISATLWGFETLLAGNAWIRSEDELWRHIAESAIAAGEADPADEWGAHPTPPTHEDAERVLLKSCAPGWGAEDAVKRAVGMLDQETVNAIAYRGNLYAFLRHERAQDLLAVALSGEIREADPDKMEEHHPEGKKALEDLWEGVRKWVAFHWLPADMPARVAEMEREVVILGDTDSTFLHLAPWMEFLGGCFDLTEATEEERLTALNAAVYVLRLSSDFQMGMLTRNLGVPEEKRKLINFKSEFVISRMVLTSGKKHYVALLQFQEGARIVGDKVELKGLALKKTNVPRSTGKYFEKAIETCILRPPAVNRVEFARNTVELERRVRESISSGSLEYSTPGVLGRVSEYKDMYSIPAVRGMIAWNFVYENSPIREGDRINMLRLRVNTDVSVLAAAMEELGKDTEDGRVLALLAEKFFGASADEGLARNGLNWLAVPKDQREIPAWARPLIDIESIAQANVSTIYPIMESVGIMSLRLPAPEVYSTTIPF